MLRASQPRPASADAARTIGLHRVRSRTGGARTGTSRSVRAGCRRRPGACRAGRGSPARSSAPARRWTAPPGLLAVHAGGRSEYGIVCPVVSMQYGTDHQRDGLGFDLADAAMLPRVLVVGIVHQHVRELVREGLDLRGRVHVLPHRDSPCLVVGHAVRAGDHPLVRHPQHLEPRAANLPGQPLPQARWCFTFQQRRRGRDREWFAVGLGASHTYRGCADHPGTHHLGLGFSRGPAPPQPGIGRRCCRPASRARRSCTPAGPSSPADQAPATAGTRQPESGRARVRGLLRTRPRAAPRSASCC